MVGCSQSRSRRNNIDLKVGLIQRLIDCNDHESASEFTVEVLKKLAITQALAKNFESSDYTFTTRR